MTTRLPWLALSVALASGCDRSGDTVAITHTRTATVPVHPAKLDATSEERFGGGRGGHEHGHGSEAATPPAIACEAPPGWKEKPDHSGMRLASYAVPGDPDADCGVTLLPSGGGVEANVNRWRKQMGLPDASPEEIAKLPKRQLLAGDALLVELEGSYSGMGGAPKPGYKLLGAVRPVPPAILFVKMVGPKAVIEAERGGFEALLRSIRTAKPLADPGGAKEAPEGGSFKWDVPQGWTLADPRSMRLVSFNVGPSGETECYVVVLGGDGGGLLPNANRWRGQLGAPPLDDAALAKLPRVRALGQDLPLIDAAGDYTDMRGQKHTGYALLGVVCRAGDSTLFVKMTGQAAEVRAERDRFVAFVGSLRPAGG